jgi:hypothetical protein
METEPSTADFLLRAQAVREIANGVFDKVEREIVLKFVTECEKLKLSRTPSTHL